MTDPRQRHPSGAAARRTTGQRDQVLARRRLALIVLMAAVPVTLVAAIVTGSTLILIVNLVFDLIIAGYVALLLQIKQGQERRQTMGGARSRGGVPARS